MHLPVPFIFSARLATLIQFMDSRLHKFFTELRAVNYICIRGSAWGLRRPTGIPSAFQGKSDISHCDALYNTIVQHCITDTLQHYNKHTVAIAQTSSVETSNITISFLQHKSVGKTAKQNERYIFGALDCQNAECASSETTGGASQYSICTYS